MDNRRILISGAGVAGPALAHWLTRHGFEATVVERAPGPRPGGHPVDVRGPALEVAGRMGILDELRRRRTDMRGMSVVDADGTELYRSTEHTISGGDLDSPDVEILRDDLCAVIASVTEGTEYLYDDSIAGMTQDGAGVRVTFERSAPRTFDLVVGADGLHSTVRRLAFGPEADFIHHLGTYLGVFTTPNFLGLDRWQVWHRGETGGGCVMTARDNTELRVYAGFESAEPVAYDHRDTAAHKRLITERLAGTGWEFPRALEYMAGAEDFHFDAMAQIRMDRWSDGRVTLLGDAGYCGSPLSGQGTSMAMVGAYVLAGELKAAGGDHHRAFAAYEAELRDYVAANQELALTNRERMETEGAVPDVAEVVEALKLKDY
ncbi:MULTISPECIES: FAD-dependent monooxygenase [Streptomycetaceae]|uniref:FAD-binding domain-containing protein n=1 Tax=Streptantibioticus cattleyicolor (strain ATCC 35852 / DSM 46488 / JCM 4925 / NBRC 14057 / NRRL 8057) TaxID=1003195 RepID=F8JRJ1_STREN|nr:MULTISPECIES: FAD-dependent monooxygenase [Streptomycetaceae]AEW97877.1 hypothetical protein SCATT_55060 [Streptantibioticus cattleyicolor NRRL 8057 = DSM 46488]MYS62287.1 FAD-dependent oxidoreductase [Streptomyces sp. SID5468]CCB78192.1 conserved protein of unknown function [Streptantibioticus cattleyicolor NRRL 8057 = DSM 46488]